MNINNAVKTSVLILALSGWAGAAELNQNTADINQDINVPGMALDINPGGTGCNTGAHEVWEPSQGGCSDIEYQKTTARVVSVIAGLTTIEAGSGSTTFTAQVVTENGKVAPPGVLVKWLASNGNLAVPQGVTDSNGQARNTLSGASAGSSTVTATAAQGGATATVVVKVSRPVIVKFTETGYDQRNIAYPNTVFFDGYYGTYLFGSPSRFTWAATGADRYVLADNYGNVLYSGTGTSYETNNWQTHKYYPSGEYTLTAYKGSLASVAKVSATVIDYGCYSCGN